MFYTLRYRFNVIEKNQLKLHQEKLNELALLYFENKFQCITIKHEMTVTQRHILQSTPNITGLIRVTLQTVQMARSA